MSRVALLTPANFAVSYRRGSFQEIFIPKQKPANLLRS